MPTEAERLRDDKRRAVEQYSDPIYGCTGAFLSPPRVSGYAITEAATTAVSVEHIVLSTKQRGRLIIETTDSPARADPQALASFLAAPNDDWQAGDPIEKIANRTVRSVIIGGQSVRAETLERAGCGVCWIPVGGRWIILQWQGDVDMTTVAVVPLPRHVVLDSLDF